MYYYYYMPVYKSDKKMNPYLKDSLVCITKGQESGQQRVKHILIGSDKNPVFSWHQIPSCLVTNSINHQHHKPPTLVCL